MRSSQVAGLVFLVLAAAACGGGGGGRPLLPPAAPASTPANGSNGSARAIRLYIPPPPAGSSNRKRYYIAPGTQSFGVLAVAASSTQTPSPTNMQIFPVATPSPCAAASGGGLECTLEVQAPFGNDVFYLAAFAVASPGANAVPLSEFESGIIDVGGSPNPNASPFSFTLGGVVNAVTLTVPSPDPPGSNMQLFPAGAASTWQQLGINAVDSTGASVLSQANAPFATPIVISVSPSGAGVNLALTPTCPSSSTSSSRRRNADPTPSPAAASSVTVTCAEDLANVQFSYDGTITPDASDHITDTFSIVATAQQQSATPAPAMVGLTSNVLTWPLVPGAGNVTTAALEQNPAGGLAFLANTGAGISVGTFDTATYASQLAALNGTTNPSQFAIAPAGSLWIADNGNLDCYTGIGSAAAGPAATMTASAPNSDQMWISSAVVDSSNNVWFVGYDYSGQGNGQEYAGYVNVASGCSAAPASATPQFTLAGDTYDYNPAPYLAVNPAGGIVVASESYYNANGVYVANTSSPATIPLVPDVMPSAGLGRGVAVDTSGDIYASFSSYPNADIESTTTQSSTLASILTLPSTDTSGAYPNASPAWMTGFAPGATIDRLEYADTDYAALGLIEGVPTALEPVLVNLPNASSVYQTAYSSKGAEYVLYEDGSGSLDLARVLPTTHWGVPATQLYGHCTSSLLLAVLERGDSSPFTLSFSSGSYVSTVVLPGTTHDFYLTDPEDTASFNVTVTDGHGRSEVVPITSTFNFGCGAVHRRAGAPVRNGSVKTPSPGLTRPGHGW